MNPELFETVVSFFQLYKLKRHCY